VRLGNSVIADSRQAVLLIEYGPGRLPTYFVPRADVTPGALVDEHPGKGGVPTWSVVAGRSRAESAA
jgi:uncharacterized protein (DUF427 family)